MDKKFRIFVH